MVVKQEIIEQTPYKLFYAYLNGIRCVDQSA